MCSYYVDMTQDKVHVAVGYNIKHTLYKRLTFPSQM